MDVTRDEKKQLKLLEKALNYTFAERKHLKRALTHRSYANEQRLPATDHNERYEYLGDAVLSLAISHLLMDAFPHVPEGELSKLRASVVNEHQLAELARTLQLGEFLFLGKGEEQTGGREKNSLIADCFEAVLGAIYADRGFEPAFVVVAAQYAEILARAQVEGLLSDFKTRLQEEAQSRFRQMPRYRLMRESGPDHNKRFEVNLFIGDEMFGVGEGPSKKIAEQAAAKVALTKLGVVEERSV